MRLVSGYYYSEYIYFKIIHYVVTPKQYTKMMKNVQIEWKGTPLVASQMRCRPLGDG